MGDYVQINIPKLARFEWHPFTISSAPEHPSVFWVHIRALGNWTIRLHDYLKEQVGNLQPTIVLVAWHIFDKAHATVFQGVEVNERQDFDFSLQSQQCHHVESTEISGYTRHIDTQATQSHKSSINRANSHSSTKVIGSDAVSVVLTSSRVSLMELVLFHSRSFLLAPKHAVCVMQNCPSKLGIRVV